MTTLRAPSRRSLNVSIATWNWSSGNVWVWCSLSLIVSRRPRDSLGACRPQLRVHPPTPSRTARGIARQKNVLDWDAHRGTPTALVEHARTHVQSSWFTDGRRGSHQPAVPSPMVCSAPPRRLRRLASAICTVPARDPSKSSLALRDLLAHPIRSFEENSRLCSVFAAQFRRKLGILVTDRREDRLVAT